MNLRDIRKALGLAKDASREQMAKALQAAFLYADALGEEEPKAEEPKAEEKPAEEPPKEGPAEEKKDEEKAASVKLADSPDAYQGGKPAPDGPDEPSGVKPLADDAAAEAPADAPPPEADKADEKVEALALLSQILGLEAGAALTWLRDNAEALKAFAASGSGGPPMGDAGGEFMNKAATARITALKAEVESAHASHAKALAEKDAKIAELTSKLSEGEVDGLIREGKILDSERAFAVQCAQKDHALFEQWYSSKSTKVPTQVIAASTPTPGPVDMHSTGVEDELRLALERNLRHAISDPDKRRARIDAEVRRLSEKRMNGRV